MKKRRYLPHLRNPIEPLLTKKVLRVNPTAEPQRAEKNSIRLLVYDYDATRIEVKEFDRVDSCFPYAATTTTTWINVDGLRKTDVEQLCNSFGIHYLIAEDIQSIGQRPKMDDMEGVLYCVLNMLYFNEQEDAVEIEQISIVLGRNFVISFQEDARKDVFNPLREKLQVPASKVRQQRSDFLFYSMLDLIVDNYFLLMEKLGEKIEVLEEDILRSADNQSLSKINQLRKEMIILKRSIAPVRELLNGILRSETELIEDRTEKYIKDVYDHIIQANDLAENYRDMMMNIHDLYINSVNLRMNEVMKVMAIVTCLLAPATVIGGIFGMNFETIPLLHNKWGFLISVALMLLVPIAMMGVFKRRGWF
jgi:magnesium transporter